MRSSSHSSQLSPCFCHVSYLQSPSSTPSPPSSFTLLPVHRLFSCPGGRDCLLIVQNSGVSLPVGRGILPSLVTPVFIIVYWELPEDKDCLSHQSPWHPAQAWHRSGLSKMFAFCMVGLKYLKPPLTFIFHHPSPSMYLPSAFLTHSSCPFLLYQSCLSLCVPLFSPSLLLRLCMCPSTPSPASHTPAPNCCSMTSLSPWHRRLQPSDTLFHREHSVPSPLPQVLNCYSSWFQVDLLW